MPPLRPQVVPIGAGDLLVFATDGIRSAFASDLRPTNPPQRIADDILARHARGTDDALVLAVRFLGGPA